MSKESVLAKYSNYEAVIGMEVHVQLNTNTKIFCRCPNERAQEPNSNICQICLGYPGVLPVLNKKVVDYAIQAALATNCKITPVCEFSRKHYFYPDLPKNYQITQNERPIATEGYIPIRKDDGSIKKIRLIRIHMEEDAGKNIHAADSDESFVDLNRAGTPLLEVVSYPDISDTDELKSYLKALRSIVQYLGICTGNMEDGAFRADTNISVRKKGDPKLGIRCELKNINSFKFISDATEYEIERQILILENGGTVNQETRLWDTKEHRTISMRGKEEAADYRYFIDPDLPLVEVGSELISRIKDALPELPEQKFERLQSTYGISAYEAEILINDVDIAHYFEQASTHTKSKQLINWILRDVMALVKDQKISIDQCKVTPEKLASIVDMLDTNKINNHAAKEVFETVAQTGKSPVDIVKEKGLEQVGSAEELEAIVTEIISQNPDNVAQYKAGRDRLMGFFVGQAMKQTKGRGNPQMIQEFFKKHLG